MPTFRWTVDYKNLNRISQRAWHRFNRLRKIDEQKFYAGFKLGVDKHMFEEELKDLEIAYRARIQKCDEEMEYTLPNVIEYMKDFIKAYECKEEIREKLENLIEKRDRPLPSAPRVESSCGGCNE